MKKIIIVLLAIHTVSIPTPVHALSINSFGIPYTQDFDTLASTGTSSSVPDGWTFSEAGSGSNGMYGPGTGSGTSGDTYSFGASGSTDRAFGGLRSGSLIPTIGVSFLNETTAAIVSLSLTYTGEQWRLGALNRPDRLDFQYSLNASSLTTGTWTDVDSLDFVAPTTTGTVGALNGNDGANRVNLSDTITGLNIPDGATFWLRWTDLDASGSDDGLAIDDFSLTAGAPLSTSVPEPFPLSCTAAALIGILAAARRVSRD